MTSSTMQMPKSLTSHQADPLVVEAWVRGWALSRRTAAPMVFPIGFRVDVGLPEQKARYVLPEFQAEVVADLASRIDAPWTFIKVCTEPRSVAEVLPKAWTVQAPGFMMTTALADHEASQSETVLPKGYAANVSYEGAIIRAEVTDTSGDIAASGQCALDRESGIFDQIGTHEDHRRRGLGSVIMKLLSGEAAARGSKQGVLVATADGLALYGTLGWTLHSPLTSAVIIPSEEGTAER